MGLIGYAGPYIPVEMISAAGYQPYSLLHGDYELMQEGTHYVRIDACPLVRANIAYVIRKRTEFAACIGAVGCDMSRRMFDIIHQYTGIPVYILHVPRTDNRQIFDDEIDWLIDELVHLSGKDFREELPGEIRRWNAVRERWRQLELQRAAYPSLLSTRAFHEAVRHYHKGNPELEMNIPENPSSKKPRVYLVGSELSYESADLLRSMEENLCIVGDSIYGLSRFLNVSIKTPDLDGLKTAYYDQPPCIYRRSNRKYYDHIIREIQKRQCQGLMGFTLDYCDAYEFELKHIEDTVGLPVLRLRTDYSFQKMSQLKTRLAAFGEMLC